ncbi:hypothetical protein LF1_10550 [Rubripirellula obstinata]|uniref:Uncharacterized protein n=1 Tax=Rubripirellula obstinata TaxID=406547 RepID=A0A5B1CF66_9BACT|nr:hypothetical protein LF1_10550 [Rubripirellula obstinata]
MVFFGFILACVATSLFPQRREEFWSRKTPVSSFSRVGIAPRDVRHHVAQFDAQRINDLGPLHDAAVFCRWISGQTPLYASPEKIIR